ncbi:MAG TPA: restriction endonuclease subunit S [Candidatus Methanomethylophilaceae archaeon]|nr:restriction endonuclease subunit S [Candidatus Methanomethylophilaceae archaeon]
MFEGKKFPIKKISEIFKTQSGGTPLTSKREYYENGTIPWVVTSDVLKRNIESTEKCITVEGLKNSSAKMTPVGSVLVTMYGTIGEPGILRMEACTNQAVCAILPSDKIIPEYLMYFIMSKKHELISNSAGGVQKNISQGKIREMNIPIPPIKKQDIFLKFVKQVDKSKFIAKQCLEKYNQLVKSRFIEMFGDPIINPKNWKTKKMSEVAPLIQGNVEVKRDQNWLLNLDAIESDTGIVRYKNYVASEELNGSLIKFNTVHVLYSKLRPYLNKVVMPDESGFGTSELLTLLPNQEILNRTYLSNALRSDSFVQMFSIAVVGAKMPRVSMKTFKEFQLPLPPLNLQNRFEDFVKQVDKSKFNTNFHYVVNSKVADIT